MMEMNQVICRLPSKTLILSNFDTEIEFNLGEDTPDIENTLYPSVSDITGDS